MTTIIYQCFNCGSEIEIEEELDINIPEINRWNVCEDCRNERNTD